MDCTVNSVYGSRVFIVSKHFDAVIRQGLFDI